MKNVFILLFLSGLGLIITGCAMGMDQIRQSEAAAEFAKEKVAAIDTKKLMDSTKLPSSELESTGPLLLYNANSATFSSDLVSWSFVQSLKRKDGIECFLYINFDKSSKDPRDFDMTSYSQLYCFPDHETRIQAPILL